LHKLYTIGQASAMIDIPVKTIRYYESIGLCSPSVTDENSGYRYYCIDDIFRLDLIRCLGRQLGMPLANIKSYLEEGCSAEVMKQYLREQALEIDSQIAELHMRKSFLQEKLAAITERENTPPLTPVLIRKPAREIAVKKGSATSLEDGMLYARKIIAQHGDGHEKNLYVIFDRFSGSFSGEKPDMFYVGIDACSATGLEPMTLPAGDYLCIHYHNGPGEREKAVALMENYMNLHGLIRQGPVINGGSLIDMSSAFSKDYYFATEFLVKLTNL